MINYDSETISRRIKRKQTRKKIFSILITIFLVPILIINITLIVKSYIYPTKTPSLFGIKTYIIISGSMKPSIDIGDIVIVKETNKEEIKVNDIISYRDNGQTVVTHRVDSIEINDKKVEYVTKGDNNNTEDKRKITEDKIEGKVIYTIKKIGNVLLLLKDKRTLVCIALAYYIYVLHQTNIKRKKILRKRKKIEYEEKNLDKEE